MAGVDLKKEVNSYGETQSHFIYKLHYLWLQETKADIMHVPSLVFGRMKIMR